MPNLNGQSAAVRYAEAHGLDVPSPAAVAAAAPVLALVTLADDAETLTDMLAEHQGHEHALYLERILTAYHDAIMFLADQTGIREDGRRTPKLPPAPCAGEHAAPNCLIHAESHAVQIADAGIPQFRYAVAEVAPGGTFRWVEWDSLPDAVTWVLQHHQDEINDFGDVERYVAGVGEGAR
jgi:hypothetical protein